MRTQHLHNAGFVNFMMDIAIRFSKKGVVNVVDAEGNMKVCVLHVESLHV